MPPDFSNKTINTLAKRAAFKCSNPDCRVNTVGPNSEADKATVIGEAAHIFGARASAKRHDPEMTDSARAEITNAIWLCRNCHKLIDTDEPKYSADILFAWREHHEEYIQSELGNANDKIQFEKQNTILLPFKNYPPLIRRIVIDKPPGWEYRLTAELMRHLNGPPLRKIRDLQEGLYLRPQRYLDVDEVIKWVQKRSAEASTMFEPMVVLVDRLKESWGPPGKSGNIEEIHHITCLIRDYLEQVVKHEEKLYFVNAPEEYEELIGLYRNLIGSQVTKITEIPILLDEAVSLIDKHQDSPPDKPIEVKKKTIVLEVPDDWGKKADREINRLKKLHNKQTNQTGNGCASLALGCSIAFLLIMIFSC